MTVTISRAQRDALYEEAVDDLSAVGDIEVALDSGKGEEARYLWRRFDADLRLLDQIGWARTDPREEFTIDLPPELLVRVLGRMEDRAEHAISEHLAHPMTASKSRGEALKCSGYAVAPSSSSPMRAPGVSGHEGHRMGNPDQVRIRFARCEVDLLVDVLRQLRAEATRTAAETYGGPAGRDTRHSEYEQLRLAVALRVARSR
jgi:hypothetical protein